MNVSIHGSTNGLQLREVSHNELATTEGGLLQTFAAVATLVAFADHVSDGKLLEPSFSRLIKQLQ